MPDRTDYLAPPDALRAAADASDDAICRRLDHHQVIALAADAVWRIAHERGHAEGLREAAASAQRPCQSAYERGVAEGRRQAAEGLEREWGVASLDRRWPLSFGDDEEGAREHATHRAGRAAVSRLTSTWELAEPEPDRLGPGPGGPSSCCPVCGDPYIGGPGCYADQCANDEAGQDVPAEGGDHGDR